MGVLKKMSEINSYGTELIYGYVFPHWYLCKLINKRRRPYIVNGVEMRGNTWGLTNYNDPSFLFDMDPMKDYMEGVAEDCPDELCPDAPEGYMEMLEHYQSRTHGWIYKGYKLVKAAIEAGWDENEGGIEVFISHKMWECLERCNWEPVEKYD